MQHVADSQGRLIANTIQENLTGEPLLELRNLRSTIFGEGETC